MRFAFIVAEKANHSIAAMCRCLQVSRSGYYAWCKAKESARQHRDRRLAGAIRAIHRKSRNTYGSPRIHAELQAEGQAVSRKRVARLMRADGLAGRRPRRFTRTTDSRHPHPIAANVLDRQFAPGAPQTWWVGDVTFIRTLEGWLYLAVILDLTTRLAVGWSMSATNDRHLVLAALEAALQRQGGVPPHGHHSDRGSTYACDDYRKRLAALGIVCSMSRRGNCWDNAVPESFFSSLKGECLDLETLRTRAEARSAVFEYIEVFYNRERRHSSLGYLSPEAYASALNS